MSDHETDPEDETDGEDGADGGDRATRGDETEGVFVVTHADEDAAVVRDVETARVHPLSSNPGLAVGDVLEAAVAPDPPMEVSWRVVDVTERRSIDVTDADLAPTTRVREAAADAETGALVRLDRAGSGEIHVLSVPPEEIAAAAEEVLDDPETVARAARLEAVRVEVRRDDEAGVLSVRYLPD